MNKIIISGRLVRDSELSYIASTATPKISFTLVVERNYQKDKNNKTFTKVVANEIEFLGGATTEKKTNTDTLEFTDFQEVDNDEIPF